MRHRTPSRIPLAMTSLVTAVLLAGCGGTTDPTVDGSGEPTVAATSEGALPEGAVAVQAASDIGVGTERLLIGIAGPGGERLGSPDLPVEIEVTPDGDGAPQRASGIWTDIVPGEVGLYRATFAFDEPGLWTATVHPATGAPLDPVAFEVKADTSAPALGETAPAPATPTLADHTLAELTSDPDPDEAFYQLSLDETVGNGRPTVLVFSTPAFCQTSACGPLLDHVKSIAPDHPEADFIHVEVYTGLEDPDFAPDAAHLAPAVGPDGFALPSEPWVFVLDDAGVVAARFEGVMAPEELATVLDDMA